MKKQHAFFAVVAFQLLSLVDMIGTKYATVLYGQTVILETRPIDPRDLLRGDFVRLNFAITNLDPGTLGAGGYVLESGDAVYVLLQKSSPAWTAVGVSRERPSLGPDQAVIKGTVRGADRSAIRVDYGIDSYYVPEHTGRSVERLRYWRVKLGRRGGAVIEGPATEADTGG